MQLCASELISRTDDDMLMFIWPERGGRIGNNHRFVFVYFWFGVKCSNPMGNGWPF